MNSTLKYLLTVAALALATATPSFAQNTVFTLTSAGLDDTQDIKPSSLGVEDVYAGTYNATLATSGVTTNITVYCVDPTQDINFGNSYNATVSSLVNGIPIGGTSNFYTTVQSEEVAYLVNTYAGLTTFTSADTVANTVQDFTATNNQAAVQLAIWQILDPSGTYISSSYDGTPVSSLATGYENQAVADYSSESYANDKVIVDNAGTQQNFAYVAISSGGFGLPPGVPEPSLLAFLVSLTMAAGIMIVAKRRSTLSI